MNQNNPVIKAMKTAAKMLQNCSININCTRTALKPEKIREAAEFVCSRHGNSEITISITILNNKDTAELNRKYLNHNWATDCISFELSDEHDHQKRVFEIIVNAEKAAEEAKARNHSPESELLLYIIHGLLHHLGFDDAQGEQAKLMHEEEDSILKKLGYGTIFYHGNQ